MYLAQNINNQDVNPDFYINIFETIIRDKNSEVRSLVDNAIIEASQIAKGEKDIYSINNSYYFLVTTLLQKFRLRLPEINQDQIPDNIYPEILQLLR